MRRRKIVRLLCFVLIFSFIRFPARADGVTDRVSAEPIFPGIDWEHETNGLSQETTREVDAFVHTLDTTGLMVVTHGRVIYEYGDVKRLSYLASARKSVLSMLYGAEVATGKIHLDATLKDLGLSDLGGLLPIEERAKVIDVITARSGVYHPAAYPGDLLSLAPKRGSKEPGTYWLYSNWDFDAAGDVFERMTGKNIFDALRDDLAIPIGMEDFDRKRQQKTGDLTRSQYPAYVMVLSTRDMARLGYLMLRQGKWRDRQIIPAEWVSRSTSVRTPLAEMQPAEARAGPFGYGYMWWVWDGPSATGPYQGACTADGAYGQYITILPALDMIVAHKTWPAGFVSRKEYLRLLDLLTGKHPATSVELHCWEIVPGGYDSYLGQYRVALNTTLGTNPVPSVAGLRREGNRLFVDIHFPARPESVQLRLSPMPEADSFEAPGGRRYSFYRDAKGDVTRLTARIYGQDVTFEKFSHRPTAVPAFEKSRLALTLHPRISDGYAGRYTLVPHDALGATQSITIKRDGDALIGQMFTGRNPRRFAEAYFPESETHFFDTTEDEELTFVKNDRGEVTGVIVDENGLFGDFARKEYQLDK